MSSEHRVALGTLGRPHGVRGAIRFFPYNTGSDLLASLGSLELGELGRRKLLEARRTPKHWIVTLEGVSDCEAAQALQGLELWLSREELPEVEEGNYLFDLIGQELFDESKCPLGKVLGLVESGAQVLLEIEDEGGRWLLPPNDHFLLRREPWGLVVRLPEGLRESQR